MPAFGKDAEKENKKFQYRNFFNFSEGKGLKFVKDSFKNRAIFDEAGENSGNG